MATFVNNLRLKEITPGDEVGTWGFSTNTNLELIADGFGSGTIQLAGDANETFTMDDGAADPTRALVLNVTSAVSLTAARTVTLAPNTVNKLWIIKNSTTGGQAIAISQGSGANVTIQNGETKIVYSDGQGSGAAVIDAAASLSLTRPSIQSFSGFPETLTELQALSPSDGDTTFMLGRSAAGDGGEGLFRFNSADKSTEVTADARSAIWVPPSSDTSGASGAWERIDGPLKTIRSSWLGAVADNNTTDNAPILQDGVDALRDLFGGGTLYIDPSADANWIGIRAPIALWDYIEVCGDSVNSRIRNYSTTSANAASPVFLIGNVAAAFGPTDETKFDLDAIAAGDKTVTFSSAGDASNFSVGDVVFIWSDEFSDAPAHVVPVEQQMNEIIGISGGVLTLKYKAPDAIANANITRVGISGTVTGFDGRVLWCPKGVSVHDLVLANPDNQVWFVFQFCGGWESHIYNLTIEDCIGFMSANACGRINVHDINVKRASRSICDIAYFSIGSTFRDISAVIDPIRDPSFALAHGEAARDCTFENWKVQVLGDTDGINGWRLVALVAKRSTVRNWDVDATETQAIRELFQITFNAAGTGTDAIQSQACFIGDIRVKIGTMDYEALSLTADNGGSPGNYNVIDGLLIQADSMGSDADFINAGASEGAIVRNVVAPGLPVRQMPANLSTRELFFSNIQNTVDDLPIIVNCVNERFNNTTKTAIRTYSIPAGTLGRSSGLTYGASVRIDARALNTNGTNLYVDLDVGAVGNLQFNIPSTNRGVLFIDWDVQFHAFNGGTSYAKCVLADGTVLTDYAFLSSFDFDTDDLDLVVSTNNDSASDDFDLNRYEVQWFRGYITDRR